MAVCCASASLRSLVRLLGSLVRWRNPLNKHAFSMAITAWSAKSGDKLNLVLGERLNLQPPQDQNANKIVLRNMAPRGLPSVDEYRVTDWPDAARLLGPLGDQSAKSMSQNVQMKLATAVPVAFKASDLP